MNKTLKKTTLEYIDHLGFRELTKVQETCIDLVNGKKDLIVISKTGTGKTHAYLLPIMEMINTGSDKTQVLISLPTRELAYQVYENARKMIDVLPDLRIAFLSGGTDKKRSMASLTKQPHIIIGTPGRIRDLFEENVIRVDFVQMYVIDEADMTLEYGFLEDIDVVFSHMVKDPEVLCFSATYPQELQVFTKKYLSGVKVIQVQDEKRDPKISHILIPCKHRSYEETLYGMLEGFNPYVCLIFANSKEEADRVHSYLEEKGVKTLLLHGGLESRERQRALKALSRKEYTYVIASDVASRGIDIDGITHVVSLGFPKELQFYTHRAGRTGRNTREGICYALYQEDDLEAIKKLAAQGIQFKAREYKNGKWKTAVNPTAQKKSRFDLTEKEIAQTLKRKNEKVKPNYKKKKNQEIEKIKRKKKREFIQSKIKEERKERYKAKAKEKM
ncbi:MAG: DEAD/DEAH box helicase [Erysipelotrichaceae bacterium]|nr:DEAD/DEAH box helicase [Erysipelotrichaceae bacterium]